MSVSLLLPLNGANNGTVFTDYSPTPKTITRYGDVKTVTAQSKFYGSSAYFDGNGDYLTVSDPSAFSLASGDFTIGFWWYGAARSNRVMGNRDNSGGWLVAVTPGTSFSFAQFPNYTAAVGSAPPVNEWCYLEICRFGNVVTCYLNGVAGGTPLNSANRPGATGVPMNIGRDVSTPSADQALGYMQDLRITNSALHTANFTPPGRLLKSVSGVIRDRFGSPCQRKVYAMSRPTDATAPQILAHGLSDTTTGAYELLVPSGEEVTRVVVSEDGDPLLNDLADRVIPA